MGYKKFVSLLLVVAMVISSTSIAFGSTSRLKNGLDVTKLSDESIVISDGEESARMEHFTSGCEDIYTVSFLGEGEDFYFLVNNDNHTIYSSATGKTITMPTEEYEASESFITGSDEIQGVVATYTKRISYKRLAELVTPTSSQISIAAAVILIISLILGVTISTPAAVVVALLSTPLWDKIRKGIVNRSPDHGLKAVVQKKTQRRHEGGKIVYGYSYSIASLGTY